MSEITIIKAQNPADRAAFSTFPWKLYQDDPLWVPPLYPDLKQALDPAQGTFLQRGEADLFLAYKDGRLAGTICAAEDPPTNRNRGTSECVFGFFDYIEDFDVFRALVETARDWGRSRGLTLLYGPWNLDYENAYGVLVEGRDVPPALMCGHSPPYYHLFMERFGFQPARAENVALRIDLEDSPRFDRLARIADRVRGQGKITIRSAEFDRWYPWNYLQLLWLMKTRQPACLAVKSVLVLPEFWNTGVIVLLMDEMVKRAKSQGYEWIDMSITSADNPTSVLTAEKMGAEIYKRWQVYHYPI
ncbi:MAG: GNAT family N-acetyltransferase [Anaerolineales bacterium]